MSQVNRSLGLADLPSLLLPLEIAVLLLVIVAIDLGSTSIRRKTLTSWVTLAGLCVLFVLTFVNPADAMAMGGRFRLDAWSSFLNRWFLVAGIIVVLGTRSRLRRMASRRQGEYYLLLLFSLLGMVLLTSACDLVLLLLCFELASIPLFIMAAIENRKGQEKRLVLIAEGALKFFLVGVVSTPIALLGFAFIFGLAGDSSVAALASVPPSPLLRAGLLLVLAGMGFKLGVVPFHMWIPDTYQAAPAPFVAFLSTAPKFAAVAALARIFVGGLGSRTELWVPAVTTLCVATLVMGNFWALGQRTTKRMLAYSGIGHIGYFLMALLGADTDNVTVLLFYWAAYLLTNVGAFLVVEAVAGAGEDETIDAFAGLSRRSPWLALAMLLFLLSLVGIPFVVGFWAKLYVFLFAWKAGYSALVVAGALLAVVALYYYLQLARSMYMVEPKSAKRIVVRPALATAIVICLVGVIGYGLYPKPLLDSARNAATALAPTKSPLLNNDALAQVGRRIHQPARR
jgi:NADH-quinone oxidoreductase subunit N